MIMRTFACKLSLLLLIITGCTSGEIIKESPYAKNIDHMRSKNINFMFTAYDRGIDNPNNDRRAYYKIFIDKVESGRTTSGLESQKKIFETKLDVNRHLLTVQKWVLNKKTGRYVKLNNIDQPKPNFVYFTIPPGKIVILEMVSDKNRRTLFTVKQY